MAAPAVIADTQAARALFAPIAHLRQETVACAYLDRTRRLLGMRHAPSDSATAADVPVRAIVGDMLALHATALVLAHNHPSGDPAASLDDVAATRRLVRTLDALGVTLLDHLILAGARWTSFREEGRL